MKMKDGFYITKEEWDEISSDFNIKGIKREDVKNVSKHEIRIHPKGDPTKIHLRVTLKNGQEKTYTKENII